MLTVGSLSLAGGSQTNIEIGGLTRGTQFDAILSSGNVSLGGILQISLVNNFTPQLGQSFDIFDLGSQSGTFSTLQLPTLSGGPLGWDISQLYTTGTLTVATTYLHGDWNRDGVVTESDIPAMLGALADLANYAVTKSLTPAQLLSIGDFDSSGDVTNRDIQGMLDYVISHASGSSSAVPEPATVVLVCIGGFCAVRRRRRVI